MTLVSPVLVPPSDQPSRTELIKARSQNAQLALVANAVDLRRHSHARSLLARIRFRDGAAGRGRAVVGDALDGHDGRRRRQDGHLQVVRRSARNGLCTQKSSGGLLGSRRMLGWRPPSLSLATPSHAPPLPSAGSTSRRAMASLRWTILRMTSLFTSPTSTRRGSAASRRASRYARSPPLSPSLIARAFPPVPSVPSLPPPGVAF